MFKVFEKSPLNIENCKYQKINGAAYMSGRNEGCSTLATPGKSLKSSLQLL